VISVALCTHNGAFFIAEQIRSICFQTLPPHEIILSDDASSDGTVAAAVASFEKCLAELPELSVQLKIIENAVPLRVTGNFEQAAAACCGELIALSDQDDVWHPIRLERMFSEFDRRSDLLLLHTDASLVGAERQDLGITLFEALEVRASERVGIHAGRAFDVFLRRNLVTGATTMFRRVLLESAVPFPVEWIHDEWLGIIAAAVGRVDMLEQPFIDYRQHANNQIGARRDAFMQKAKKVLAPRGTTHNERAFKAEILLNRLLKLAGRVSPDLVSKVREKLKHHNFRAALPARRLARVIPVLRETATGRYLKFGRGVWGVVRDLLEHV